MLDTFRLRYKSISIFSWLRRRRWRRHRCYTVGCGRIKHTYTKLCTTYWAEKIESTRRPFIENVWNLNMNIEKMQKLSSRLCQFEIEPYFPVCHRVCWLLIGTVYYLSWQSNMYLYFLWKDLCVQTAKSTQRTSIERNDPEKKKPSSVSIIQFTRKRFEIFIFEEEKKKSLCCCLCRLRIDFRSFVRLRSSISQWNRFTISHLIAIV